MFLFVAPFPQGSEQNIKQIRTTGLFYFLFPFRSREIQAGVGKYDRRSEEHAQNDVRNEWR